METCEKEEGRKWQTREGQLWTAKQESSVQPGKVVSLSIPGEVAVEVSTGFGLN